MKVKFLFISLSIFTLSGCDKIKEIIASKEEDNAMQSIHTKPIENTINTVKNPCLDSELIAEVKRGLLNKAKEVAQEKFKEQVRQSIFELIDTTTIKFENISEPEELPLEKEHKVCTATAVINYQGNEATTQDLPAGVIAILKENITSQGGVVGNLLTGYAFQQQLVSLGINEYDVSDFTNIHQNSFSQRIQYQRKTMYSENGTSSDGWQARWLKLPNMITAVAYSDFFIQWNSKKQKAQQEESVNQSEPQNDDGSELSKNTNSSTQEKKDWVEKQRSIVEMERKSETERQTENAEISKKDESESNANIYLNQISNIIKSHWSPSVNNDSSGTMKASFDIRPNGEITNITITGGNDLSRKALKEAIESSELPPPPKNVYDDFKHTILTFNE